MTMTTGTDFDALAVINSSSSLAVTVLSNDLSACFGLTKLARNTRLSAAFNRLEKLFNFRK